MVVNGLKHKLKNNDPDSRVYWLAQIAIQLEGIKKYLARMAPPRPREEGENRIRSYYITEYLPSYPVHIDKISLRKPREGDYQHTVRATSMKEAREKVIDKLTAERKNSPKFAPIDSYR